MQKNKNLTIRKQDEIEGLIRKIYLDIEALETALPDNSKGSVIKTRSTLNKKKTVEYIMAFLKNHTLTEGFDGEKTWIIFWLLYGLELLYTEESRFDDLEEGHRKEIVEYLSKFMTPLGGFAGSVGLIPHLGTSYPAILSVAITGTPDSFAMIDRVKLRNWIITLKDPETKGSYLIHKNGEVDLRAVYIATVAAKLFNFLDEEVIADIPEYIAKCQTYEGGLSPIPNSEAHAGYTYCGVAALAILDRIDVLNIPKLLNWITLKQKVYEGGFCGRTNKLVDSCYSLWVGGVFAMLDQFTPYDLNYEGELLFDNLALQKYLLFTCQEPKGGLKDKLTKAADFYHTSYSMAGISLSQRIQTKDGVKLNNLNGVDDNIVVEIDPRFNIPKHCVERTIAHFAKMEKIA